MSADKISIFFTGATGYIGGTVLQRLFEHPRWQSFDIILLVRNTEKAKFLEDKYGLKIALASLQELDKLSALAEDARVVIHMADNDDVDAVKAILSGMRARHEKTGELPLLIHTSGVGEIIDDAWGDYVSDTVYSDLDIPKIEALPSTALHRPVDLLVVAADIAGYARTHIVLPSFVYGVGKGPLYDAGVANPQTALIPMHVRAALLRGNVGIMGKGLSRWASVHIQDMADMYIRMLDALLTNPDNVSHGREGYFFAENGENSTAEMLRVISNALFALGRVTNPELVLYTHEDLEKYFENVIIGRLLFTNSRCSADRARRELGWTPKHTSKDCLDGLIHEVELVVQELDVKSL
ncbi:NAD-P-binding protein [Trametes meyenii]|nr:NAD-P-binding protein [Trametes meyenii]